MDGEKKEQQAYDLEALPETANDSRPVFERLKHYATRGVDTPQSLSLYEIRQISFALSLYLALDEEKAQHPHR